ncbi:MAG: hypothetical protein ACYTF1_00025 [Planctomycetota bacterium]|jgi:hypothetical protein
MIESCAFKIENMATLETRALKMIRITPAGYSSVFGLSWQVWRSCAAFMGTCRENVTLGRFTGNNLVQTDGGFGFSIVDESQLSH